MTLVAKMNEMPRIKAAFFALLFVFGAFLIFQSQRNGNYQTDLSSDVTRYLLVFALMYLGLNRRFSLFHTLVRGNVSLLNLNNWNYAAFQVFPVSTAVLIVWLPITDEVNHNKIALLFITCIFIVILFTKTPDHPELNGKTVAWEKAPVWFKWAYYFAPLFVVSMFVLYAFQGFNLNTFMSFATGLLIWPLYQSPIKSKDPRTGEVLYDKLGLADILPASISIVVASLLQLTPPF